MTSEDPYHLRQRRLIQPAFHRQRIAAYAEQMTGYAAKTSAGWKDGETRDMAEEMLHLALAIVGKTLFNAEVEGEAAGDRGCAHRSLRPVPYPDAAAGRPAGKACRSPVSAGLPALAARLDATIYRLIEERRLSGEDRGDLISMLLLARDEDDGGRMTDEQVRDEALTIFLAGHETTANALAWTWYLLSQNPDSEQKFHAELDRVLAGRTPTLDDLPHLPFTRRVLAESLRIVLAGLGGRTPSALGYAKSGTTQLKRGDIVLMAQAVMHTDPRFWDSPDAFNPERWTSGSRSRTASEVCLFPVWRRPARLYWGAVCVDGRDAAAGGAGAAVEDAPRAGPSGRHSADHHPASEVRDEDGAGAAVGVPTPAQAPAPPAAGRARIRRRRPIPNS